MIVRLSAACEDRLGVRWQQPPPWNFYVFHPFNVRTILVWTTGGRRWLLLPHSKGFARRHALSGL